MTLILFPQMSNPRAKKLYCMCLRTMKQWLRWSLKDGVQQWHVSRTHRVALDWLFDRINLDSKIHIKYINTKKPTCRHLIKEISHVMSGIICWLCLRWAILALLLVLLQWQNELQQGSREGRVNKITTYDEFDRKNTFDRVFFSLKPGEDLVWTSRSWTICSKWQ